MKIFLTTVFVAILGYSLSLSFSLSLTASDILPYHHHVPTFASGGHDWVTKKALDLVLHDLKEKNDFAVEELIPLQEFIIQHSVDPDSEENDYYTWAGHFYDPDTETNWLGGTSNTALTNFIRHGEMATGIMDNDNDNRGEEGDWVKSLSLAIHYLQDACTPHHAANLTALDSKHSAFEDYSATIQKNYSLQTNPYSYHFTDNLQADLRTILRGCSIHGKKLANIIEENDEGSPLWIDVIQSVTQEAQAYGALFLARIMLERTKINKIKMSNK